MRIRPLDEGAPSQAPQNPPLQGLPWTGSCGTEQAQRHVRGDLGISNFGATMPPKDCSNSNTPQRKLLKQNKQDGLQQRTAYNRSLINYIFYLNILF